MTTEAVIESRIVTGEQLQSAKVPDLFGRLIVARTACIWSTVNNSAIVQVANPSSRHVQIPKHLLLGHITPVTESKMEDVRAPSQNEPKLSDAEGNTTGKISAVSRVEQNNTATRQELAEALKNAFQNSTFNAHQQSQILDLCTKYRNVFSLSPQELGCCTIGEATFPLVPGTKPVDRQPYRTNPRMREVIDKCVGR